MKVLITGGTGFIGSRLVKRCLDRGDEVKVLAQVNTDAEKQNCKALEKQGAVLFNMSLTDPSQLPTAVENVDIIFHLAAAQHEVNVPDDYFWKVNVDGTRNLFVAAVAAGVKRVIHGSTIGVYGEATFECIDEESPLKPANIYGETKKEGERVAFSFVDKIKVSIIRIPEIYGPGDRRLLKLFKMINKGRFFNIGDGENKHHLMYVEDLIDGLLTVAKNKNANNQVFLFAGRDILSTNKMIESIANALEKPVPTLRFPLYLFMWAAVILETTFKPFNIKPPLHRRRMDFFKKSFILSGEKAKKLLRFEPKTDFQSGAKLTADWYKENGLL